MKKIVMMAMTVDGLIAQNDSHLANWTSGADKKLFVQATKQAGVIVMGFKTYNTIGRPLPGRLNWIMALPDELGTNQPGLLEYSALQPAQVVAKLEQRGYREMIIGGGSTINGLFLQAGLIDELWITIEPKLFGTGLPLFAGVVCNQDLELLECCPLTSQVIWLKYRVVK
jgi:dihydrofolate reductase